METTEAAGLPAGAQSDQWGGGRPLLVDAEGIDGIAFTGNPEERAIFMGPLIDQPALERFHKAVKAVRAKGRIVHGGVELTGAAFSKGSFVSPIVVAELPPDHWINKEELFLPLLSVQACASLDEGIALGNRNVCGLCAGLYSENPKEIERFLELAEAGVLYVNRKSGATTGAWPGVQSYAGWKGSGIDGKGGLGGSPSLAICANKVSPLCAARRVPGLYKSVPGLHVAAHFGVLPGSSDCKKTVIRQRVKSGEELC